VTDPRSADREISVDDFDEPSVGAAASAGAAPGVPAQPGAPARDGAARVSGSGGGPAPAGDGPTPASGWRDRLERSVGRWGAGRRWWIRAPVLLWLGWILVRLWDAPGDPTIFRGIDLAVHELGHILWAPLGEVMGFAGGTLTQLLVPVCAGVVLYRQRDWFGIAFAVAWVGINCFEIAEYAGDALARRLPLVSPTTSAPEHDWTYLLARAGLLHHTGTVAAAWLWAGRLITAAGVGFGAWVLRQMARASGRP
jgi:hypothetical protein